MSVSFPILEKIRRANLPSWEEKKERKLYLVSHCSSQFLFSFCIFLAMSDNGESNIPDSSIAPNVSAPASRGTARVDPSVSAPSSTGTARVDSSVSAPSSSATPLHHEVA